MSERRQQSQFLRQIRPEDRKYNIQRERQMQRRLRRSARTSKALKKFIARSKVEGAVPSGRSRFLAQGVVSACVLALLLGLRALPLDGARAVTDRIRTVATAEVSMDEVGRTLGELEFVSKLVPRSVQVFWDRTSGEAPQELRLPFEDGRQALEQDGGVWLIGTGAVHACGDGVLESVVRSKMGGYCATIRHHGGLESVYEPLVGVRAAPGDALRKGESFAVPVEEDGICKLFLRLELNGEPAEPLEYLKP